MKTTHTLSQQKIHLHLNLANFQKLTKFHLHLTIRKIQKWESEAAKQLGLGTLWLCQNEVLQAYNIEI